MHAHAFDKRILALVGLVVAVTALVAMTAPERASLQPSTPAAPVIAVTAAPLADIVRSVAGTGVTVHVILPPGSSPHTFEPTPASVDAISGSAVVYAIGHGFDDWIDSLAATRGVAKVTVDQGITLRDTAENVRDALDSAHDDDDGPQDPHYWLDARNAAVIARTVASDLTARFPDRADRIAANLAAVESRLLSADVRARQILAGVAHKDIVTLHDAWYYFAEAYGLHVIGSFEPSAAREPSPQYLAALEAAVKQSGVRVIYAEPGLSMAGLEAFADDNGLRIVELDPIEGKSTDGYDAVLLRDAQLIKENQR